MKKIIMMIATIALLSLSLAVMAEESDWVGDGKTIHVFSTEKIRFSDEKKLTLEEIGRGVYIRAMSNPMDEMKNSSGFIQERFTAHGIKVVDKIEDADVAIDFAIKGAVSTETADVSFPMDDSRMNWKNEQLTMYTNIVLKPFADGKWVIASSIKKGVSANTDETLFKRLTEATNSATVLKMATDQWINKFIPEAKLVVAK